MYQPSFRPGNFFHQAIEPYLGDLPLTDNAPPLELHYTDKLSPSTIRYHWNNYFYHFHRETFRTKIFHHKEKPVWVVRILRKDTISSTKVSAPSSYDELPQEQRLKEAFTVQIENHPQTIGPNKINFLKEQNLLNWALHKWPVIIEPLLQNPYQGKPPEREDLPL